MIRIKSKNIARNPLTNILILYLIVTLVLAAFFYFYYSSERDSILKSRNDFLVALAELKETRISQWLDERMADARQIHIDPIIPGLLKNGLRPGGQMPEALSRWFEFYKSSFGYETILIADTNGTVVFNSTGTYAEINSVEKELAFESVATDRVIFSDRETGANSNTLSKFFIPVNYSPDSGIERGAVIILTINPTKALAPIINRDVFKSETRETILLKTIDDKIIYLSSQPEDLSFTDTYNKTAGKTFTTVGILERKRGLIEGFDYKNVEVVAVMRRVPSTNWLLITKMSKAELYKPVAYFRNIVLLTFVSIDLFIAVLLLFVWKNNILDNFKRVYQSEIERLKSEKRFESLAREVKDYAIMILDPAGKIESWNYGVQKIIGYSEEEIIGKHFSVFYTPEAIDANKPATALKEAAEKGSYEDEGWRLKKDGSKFWASVVITALKDNDGNLFGFLKVSRDLSERKNLEREIINSRDYYLKLLSDFPNPVWRSGPDGKCDYFNNAWLKFTGRRLDEELGEGWLDNIHPEERQKIANEYYTTFNNRRSFVLEYRLRTGEGKYRWIIDYGLPFYNYDNEFAGFIGSCYDIDDRKKYEETINSLLRISEKLYSSLEIDQILDALVIESINLVQAENGFAAVIKNNMLETKRYYNKDHWEYCLLNWPLEGDLIDSIIKNKSGRITLNAAEEPLISNELVIKYSVKQAITSPLFGSNGELLGFIEVHNKRNNDGFNSGDLNLLKALAHNASVSLIKSLSIEQLRNTEIQLRNSESELRQLAAQLQNAREAERHHIAREIHDELGQLFTGINLNILFLRDRIEQKKKISEAEILGELNEVKRMVDKGIQSVRDIAEGLRSYVLEHLGLIPALKEYCKEFQRISNIKCVFRADVPDIPLADEKKVALYRIVQEALTNALRHSKATEINVDISQTEEKLNIIISDNGIGIEKVSGLAGKTFGILGMKERARYLQGEFVIKNKNGNGTEIFVSIPLSAPIDKEK